MQKRPCEIYPQGHFYIIVKATYRISMASPYTPNR